MRTTNLDQPVDVDELARRVRTLREAMDRNCYRAIGLGFLAAPIFGAAWYMAVLPDEMSGSLLAAAIFLPFVYITYLSFNATQTTASAIEQLRRTGDQRAIGPLLGIGAEISRPLQQIRVRTALAELLPKLSSPENLTPTHYACFHYILENASRTHPGGALRLTLAFGLVGGAVHYATRNVSGNTFIGEDTDLVIETIRAMERVGDQKGIQLVGKLSQLIASTTRNKIIRAVAEKSMPGARKRLGELTAPQTVGR